MADASPFVLLAKSACKDLEAHVGGNKIAAHLAGVSQSVWSDYCNIAKPECTIPIHRAMRLQERTGRRDFSELLGAADDGAQVSAADPRGVAATALQVLAQAIGDITTAYGDGVLTPAEQRTILAEVTSLKGKVAQLGECVAGARTGVLKAVS